MLDVFLILFALFVALLIFFTPEAGYTPLQWIVAGFLTLSSALGAAWEVRALWALRRTRRLGA